MIFYFSIPDNLPKRLIYQQTMNINYGVRNEKNTNFYFYWDCP